MWEAIGEWLSNNALAIFLSAVTSIYLPKGN